MILFEQFLREAFKQKYDLHSQSYFLSLKIFINFRMHLTMTS